MSSSASTPNQVPVRAVPATENDRRLVDLAHTYLREALKLDVGEPMRFDYYAHLIGGLQAKLAAAEEALQTVIEWYDRDGSVGGCANLIEDIRPLVPSHAVTATGEAKS